MSGASGDLTVVTGASGHVGGVLVRELLARGRRVRCLVHDDSRALEGLDVEMVPGDVLEPDSLKRAFEGADVVYHLAALISIEGDHGGKVWQTNVEGPRNVARAAMECGVRRLMHCSSIHAFDARPLDEPLDEERKRATTARHNAYDRSKAGGEAVVREAIAEGLDAVILHPSAVLGPYDFRISRMGEVFLNLYHRKLPSLVGGGFDWVDVRDVTATMLAAEERGRTGESYLLSGRWRSVAELAAIAETVTGVRPPRFTSPMWLAEVGAPFMLAWSKLTGKRPLYTGESLEALRSNEDVRHDKAARELGHDPRPLEETIRDVYAWFDGAGMLDPPLAAREAP